MFKAQLKPSTYADCDCHHGFLYSGQSNVHAAPRQARLALVELEAALPGRDGAQLRRQVVGLLGRAHVQAGHVRVLQPAPARSARLSAPD